MLDLTVLRPKGINIGISGKHVHIYVDWDTSCYHAGYMANPDRTNPYVDDWWTRNQNPNFFSFGCEVVAQPRPARVPPGTHLVSEETWETVLLVDEELH